MPTTDAQHELDDRFPSGDWIGFFVQPASAERYAMDLFLQFSRQQVSGSGRDLIGEFTISGAYDTETAACSFAKQYVGQHHVEYVGQARDRGIVGQWQIVGQPASWCGPFFIWPREAGDLAAEFERAFVEYDLASQTFVPQDT